MEYAILQEEIDILNLLEKELKHIEETVLRLQPYLDIWNYDDDSEWEIEWKNSTYNVLDDFIASRVKEIGYYILATIKHTFKQIDCEHIINSFATYFEKGSVIEKRLAEKKENAIAYFGEESEQQQFLLTISELQTNLFTISCLHTTIHSEIKKAIAWYENGVESFEVGRLLLHKGISKYTIPKVMVKKILENIIKKIHTEEKISVFEKDVELKNMSELLIASQTAIKEGWHFTIVEEGVRAEHDTRRSILFRNALSLKAWLDVETEDENNI